MNIAQHDINLCAAERIVDRILHEAFNHALSYQLSCRAHMGKAVWFGDLIEHSKTNAMRLQLHQFKGPPRFINGRPHLKHEFYTRCGRV